MYKIVFSKQAKKDIQSCSSKQKSKLRNIFENALMINPNEGKKLVGDLKGYYSFRLNIKDRIVYRISEKEKCVYILMCRSHYKE